MFPIRTRIILLAFFSLAFLLLAIMSEYSHVRKDVLDSEKSFSVIEEISLVSQLIHSLQKERGLTATNNKEFYTKLIKQRELTDIQLKNMISSSKLINKQDFIDLASKIEKIRRGVDNNTVAWNIIKDFYIFEIDKLLIDISLEMTELGHEKEVSHQLYAALCLLNARENLGILRANISFYYEKNELSKDEILDISYKYGIFIDKFKNFESHIKHTQYNYLKDSLNNELLISVKSQIASIIKEQKPSDGTSFTIWWKEVTYVMDSLKDVEETIFIKIKEQSQNSISVNQKHLYMYISVAVIALLLITILTSTTVIRILQALSALINSLNEVEKTQDFGLRVYSKSQDEFGQLGFSINRLLRYTDQILKEKDKLASIDLLTGVMNRRSFLAIAEQEIARSIRYEKPLCLIFCDIDKFKFINDTHGHNVGDEVLKSFAHAVSSHIRKSDYIVRWGGEEFLILAPETDESEAYELAENLRKMVMELSVSKIKDITCSFGVAQMKKNESLEEFQKRADEAMFSAKDMGRNIVCVASDNQQA